MFKNIKELGKDELVKGSLVLFFMMNAYNLLNYIFHFSMARMLGPSGYGVLAVLMSFVYIFNVPSESIQNIITNYTIKLNIKKEYGKVKFLFFKSLKKSVIISFIIFLVLIPITIFLSAFLKIDFFLFLITCSLIFFILSLPVLRGILQGRKKFFSLGSNMILEGFIKVIFSIFLVFAGWKVYGAISAVLISILLAFIFGFFFIKEIMKTKEEKVEFKGIYSYSTPFLISILAIVLIYSLDIILAKRFFSSEIAGKYAVASMLGKMIFFGTFAISKAMFPLSSESYENGKKTLFLLKKSLKIVFLISGIALLAFLFFPSLIIRILFGSAYMGVSGILFIIGLSLTILSFTNLIVLYGLSINKIKKNSFYLLIFVILEIALLSIFHSSLLQFSLVFLTVNCLMLLYSLMVIKK